MKKTNISFIQASILKDGNTDRVNIQHTQIPNNIKYRRYGHIESILRQVRPSSSHSEQPLVTPIGPNLYEIQYEGITYVHYQDQYKEL